MHLFPMTQYWAKSPHLDWDATRHLGGGTPGGIFKRKKSDRGHDKYNFRQAFYQILFPSEDPTKGAVLHL